MAPWLALALLIVQDSDQPEDIVVTARPRGCDMSIDGHVLSDGDFNSKSREWAAGKPVRVHARADADLKCLSRIAFRLADKGVTRIEFVDPQGRPAKPLTGSMGSGLSGGAAVSGGGNTDPVRDREWRFLEVRAAKLVLDGQCAEARQMLLEAGDLGGAADVAVLCRAP